MRVLLEDLNSLSGVVGSAFFDARHGVLARAFPERFDDASLGEVARAVAQSTASMQGVTGKVGVIDLRFRGGRVLVRPAGEAALLVLCDRSANAQEVLAFASVACKKFERQREQGPADPSPAEAVPPPAVPPPAPADARAGQAPGKKGRLGRWPWLLLLLPVAVGIYYAYDRLLVGPAARSRSLGVETAPAASGGSSVSPSGVAQPNVWLRLSGADALSGQLLPPLLSAYLRSRKVNDVQIDRSREDVVLVQGTLDRALVRAEVELGGSARGLSDLLAGTVDFAITTRRVRNEERQKLAVLGAITSPACEHVLALDGVAVIVNKANAVKALNREQLGRILSGQASDWSQFGLVGEDEWSAVGVGGKGGPVSSGVHVYLPEERAGVTELVQGVVMGTKAFAREAHRLPTVEEVAEAVAGDPGGIGFVPMHVLSGARPVPIFDLDDTPLLPTAFTVASEDYLLTHRLYLYTAQASQNPHVSRFLDFALSSFGQAEARKVGLVELSVNAERRAVPEGAPAEYLRLTESARRLSTTIRFEAGSPNFDSRAQEDLGRVVEYLRVNELNGDAVRLIGFADGSGSRSTNLQLSQERAALLSQALAQRGISGAVVAGMGSALPVGDNATEDGRRRNRRVEIRIAR